MTLLTNAIVTLLAFATTGTIAHPERVISDERIVLGVEFDRDHVQNDQVLANTAHSLKIKGNASISTDPLGDSLMLPGPGLDATGAYVLVADSLEKFGHMPTEQFTATAWVRIDKPTRWGGIISAVSDNGEREKGWVLGYDNDSFTLGISTTGADDGNGAMTYLNGKTPLVTGQWYMVTATFDSKSARLYVNGQLDAETTKQHGRVLYERATPFAIGAYIDSNELYPMQGRLRNAYVLNEAMTQQDITEEFNRNQMIAQLKPTADSVLEWVVEPFLCYATQTSVSVICEVPTKAAVTVRFRPPVGEVREVRSSPTAGIHTLTLDSLEPGQPYYYVVIATTSDGQRSKTDTMSFQTAVERGKAFTFVMIGDTQANPEVVKRVSDIAWSHRPNFVSIVGDLVTTGTNKAHWTHHFFPNMRPLINRIPLFPVLGNHEQNARHYYEYMNLPDPEYYYAYSYGDADFFVLDSEKPMGPDSEQYRWLEKQLAGSDARWKFVIHHRPPYSSDENDHGNAWLGPTTLGDLNPRQMVPLYEKHGVDIVFNGHVHVYERTFPIREGEAVEHNGVIYMTIGGGAAGSRISHPSTRGSGARKFAPITSAMLKSWAVICDFRPSTIADACSTPSNFANKPSSFFQRVTQRIECPVLIRRDQVHTRLDLSFPSCPRRLDRPGVVAPAVAVQRPLGR